MFNLVLRVLYLFFCYKVCDYKSFMLIGSEVKFLMVRICNKVIYEISSI